MNRREMLMKSALAAAAVAAYSNSAKAKEESHAHHVHGTAKNKALLDTSSDCVKVGEVCLDHCHQLLGQGDKSLGACAKSVSEMLAVCGVLRSLSAQGAKSLPRFAKLAAEVCKDCEDECRKHEDKHKECKDCAEACAACAQECRKTAA